MNFYQEFCATVEQQQLQATKRVIFRCKTCKLVRTREYIEWQGKFYRITPTYLHTPESDLKCPCGSKNVLSGGVVTTKTTKPCDDRCMGAKNMVCHCSCGGANHGADYAS